MPVRVLKKLLYRLRPAPVELEPVTVPLDSRDVGLRDAIQSGFYRNATDELFTGFPISSADVVLDVGCGGGGAVDWAARRGAHVVFTDIVAGKVEALLQRLQGSPAASVRGYVCDAAPLPLANGEASRITCMEVLEHVPQPKALLAELVRVGQPGALYLLSVPDARAEHIQKGYAPAAYFETPNHIHIFERDEFAALVEGAGLIIERHTTYGFYWTLWTMFYWVWAKSNNVDTTGESFDIVHPPYPPLLDDWARVWNALIEMPESAQLKAALDDLLPKSQVIVARKPALTDQTTKG
ncbi:Methyltransferase domain-containing protein [Aquipseudomonas alcaligenes]|nr:Methyltransferase domain-containing protein [Pseudomonas alcaligenes]